MVKKKYFLWVCLFVIVLFIESFLSAHTWTGELVTNGGFEWNNLTGWTTSGAYWYAGSSGWGGNGTIASGNGTYGAYTSTSNTDWTNGYIYQDVNLAAYASYIDAGSAVINATGWGISAEIPPQDWTRVKIMYLFSNGTIIETAADTTIGTQPWKRIGVLNDVPPVGTRYVRVWGNTYESGANQAGIVDSFSVKLGYETTTDTSPPVISLLPPTPSNTSSTTSPVTIVANISDTSNTSSWIDLDRSLLGYWAMDYANSTGVYDNSSYGNFMTFSGGIGVSNLVGGVRGQGLSFDGANYQLSRSALRLGTSATFDVWGYSNDFSTDMMLWNHHSVEDTNYYDLFFAGDMILLNTGDSYDNPFKYANGTNIPLSFISLNVWHHYVVVVDALANKALLYYDGINLGNATYKNPTYNPSDTTDIGGSSGYIWNGYIDEVRIYNRSLSREEILASYDSKNNNFSTSSMTLANGQHNYTVYAIDASGNTNNSGWRNFVVGADTTPPTITFEIPTPSNTSSTTSPVTIVANISDASNTSSWIDFDRSLLGYWAMDYYNKTGIYDNSTWNNFGTFAAGTGLNYTNLTTGVRGQALRFDGVNDELDMPHIDLYNRSFSFSTWVYFNSLSTNYGPLFDEIGGYSNNKYLELQARGSPSKMFFGFYGNDLTGTATITTGKWYYVVFNYDNSTKNRSIYLNGILDKSDISPSDFLGTTGIVNLGHSADASAYLNGSMDEVMVFNKSLSQTEILALYDSKSNKFNTSSMTLANGQHNYTVYAIDASGNANNSGWRYFNVGAADSTPPYFTTIPANSSLFYGNQSLLVKFTGTDAIGFGYYRVNDTRFLINQTGFLSNATPMAVGNYEINVTINDTSNNINWTRYKVQINKSTYYSCEVYFNTTSPITYPSNFVVYTNCSSAYTLYRNGTSIANVSTINAGAGYYNLTVQRTDYANYTNVFDDEFFTVNDNTENCQVRFNATSPLNYPDTFLAWANCTTAFTLKRNGTTITNNSVQSLAAGAYNFSMSRNDTANYTFYYNESQFIITSNLDITPPTITFDASTPANTSSATNPVTISANISDASNTSSWIDFDRSLAGYWAMDYYNATGVYDNSSWSNFGRFVAGTGLNYSNLTSGSRGNGLKFDGVNDRINLSKLAGITDMRAMTISAWIMPSSIDNTKGNVIFAMKEVDGAAPWGYWSFGLYTSNNLEFYRDANNINMIMRSSSNVINVGKWQHVVMTWNGSNMPGSLKFYVNGTEVGLTTNQNDSLFQGTSNYYIGNIGDGTRPFNGTMDEVMVFNRSLSPTEIKALYDSQSNKFNTSSMTLANGQHNYTVYAIDAFGNANNSGWRYFTVGGVDTTSPTYSQVSTNNTIAGQITNFAINVNDNTALNPNGMYIFSINNTGANLVNDTAVNFTTTPSWANITKTLNLTVGKVIGYRWYFNDSAGNRNSTPIYVLTTTSSGLPFSATWNTSATSAGSTNTSMIDLPLEAGGTYNFLVNWGDGTSDTITTWNDPKTNHTYSSPGVYTVNITGTIKGFRFANINDKLKIGNINSWGPLNVGNSDSIFMGCSNLNSTATDNLDLTGTTTLHQMFADATIFNGNISGWNLSNVNVTSGLFANAVAFNGNISNWNTGKVTAMNNMFYGASAFNQNISGWNTGNVTTMSGMFVNAVAFNGNISNWNTSSVTDMRSMFASATSFNQNISNWNTGNVNTMYNMFDGATSFNQNLTGWNTGNVIDMSVMFASATAFNGNISGWNTGKVTDMSSMFASATSFNQNISSWNTKSVIYMNSMFYGASAFNSNISGWNTSSVTDMSQMFDSASAFNQNISGWNTSSVITMYGMFSGASTFNQDISAWGTGKVTTMGWMFNSASAFNQNISGWNTGKVTIMTSMFQGATAFNGNISGWNTGNVTTMASMFSSASAFNQNISNWNTSNVATMIGMFGGATSFNQNIGSWNVSSLTDATNMFQGVTLSTANYDSLLMGWASRTPNLKNNTFFSGGNSQYTSAAANARNTILIGFHHWTITDGGLSTSGTFSATWNTSATSSGSTNSSQVGLPLEAGGTYNFVVNWGDGKSDTITTWNDPKINHTYSSPGVYTVNITGTIKGFRFNNARDLLKINNINSWGPLNVGNNYAYFWGCSNLNSTATDSLDLTGTTDLTFMFRDTSFNGNISNWNTSQVTKMQAMFMSDSSFNQNISNWNTGSVTNMAYMFNGATAFNQNLSNWNTSSVTDMNSMFASATAFNGNISNWNIGKVTNTMLMFLGATSFNQNLSSWNTGKVTAMNQMFFGASAFNGNISNWNTSSVQDMSYMFYRASVFNSNISNWNTSSVTSMNQMFSDAFVFNQNLSNWNTGNVYDMSGMFVNAFAFNGNISNWNTGKVIAMNNMFYGASAFNQNISGWNTGNVTTMIGMFNNAVAFNGNISGWNTGKVTNMNSMFSSATAFNQNLSNWNTTNVNNMQFMFQSATVFNGNISNWDTSKVTNMYGMFNAAPVFNQNISSWNVVSVTDMGVMFTSAAAFNQSIGNWNTSKVTSMNNMFAAATAFNQNISSWSVGNVIDMAYMFNSASSFNQNIGSWNVSSLTDAINMFQSVTLSTTNYDALLIGWASRTPVLKNNTVFSGGNSKYTSAATNARNTILIGFHNWTITDGGLSDSCSYTSGNWAVNCSNYCNITTNIDVGGNNISITGTGTFVTSANISNYNKLSIHGTDSTHICRVRCINGGCFKN